MIGTIKHSIARGVDNGNEDWDQAVFNVLYGYHRQKLREEYSTFELIYGTLPCMHLVDHVALLGVSTLLHRQVELVTAQTTWAERVDWQVVYEDSKKYFYRFPIDDKELDTRGKAMNPNVRWPPFKSKYDGPCHVTEAKHHCYDFVSPGNLVT